MDKELCKDTRFLIINFLDANEPIEYKHYKKKIEKCGFVEIECNEFKLKVFTPELALILTLRELEATNLDTQENELIEILPYFESYESGFKEGQADFEREFTVNNDTLFGTNGSVYIKSIQHRYLYSQNEGGKIGWYFVKKFYPIILTKKEIRLYGYFSGAISKVDELRGKFPLLFKDFENKEIEIKTNTTINGKVKRKPITAPVLGLFCSIIEQCNFDILGDESKADFCKRVCNTYNQKYTERVWRAYFKNMDIKLRDKNLIALKEYILPDLQADTRQKIEQLITNKTKTFV